MDLTNEFDYKHYLKDKEFEDRDAFWSARIGYELVRLYPGHGWEVHVDIKNGICNIFNRHMSALHGYRWRLQEINLSSLTSDVMRIGGEILERFGLSRERFDEAQVQGIQAATKGRAKADMS